MIWIILAAVLPSLLITWLGCYAVRRIAPRLGLVDKPGTRKVHREPVPLGGGIAIWIGTVAAFAIGQAVYGLWIVPARVALSREPAVVDDPSRQLIADVLAGVYAQAHDLWFFLAAATALMLLGLADDRYQLGWKPRILVQAIVAAVVVFVAGWRLTIFVDLPWLTGALSVAWIMGLVNSFNMLDNMDGLSAGVAAIACAILAAVLLVVPDPATHQPQLFIAGLLLVLLGALVGFLFHNRPPARLFMGDAGSYFIGCYLGVATLLATFAGGTLPRHAILAPLCVLAVPLYDTLSVVCIRLLGGKSPFEADQNHFSHRLIALGMTKGQAVLTIYLTAAACGLGALLLHQVNALGAVVILAMIACLLGVIAILETTARRHRNRY